MAQLNYHHLRYFWAVAHEGKLTRAAERLNVSQSALSVQVKKLEEQLGAPLFEREGRGLKLTEAGRIALDYADTVFQAGDELVSTLRGQRGTKRRALRVGAITTLSRNFQLAILTPLIQRSDVEIIVRSGTMRELLSQLEAHEVDLVLANQPAKRDAKTRELIALAVAAQIPCAYCVYVHNKNARANGASESEVREAVATAAHVRHWSTVLNGMAYDFDAFKAEVDSMSASD